MATHPDEHQLAALGVRRISADTDLNELVLPAESTERLRWIAGWLSRPPFIFREWGLSRYVDGGLRALFRGPSGTGKTMAATALAKWVERDLFYVDFGAVISGRVGETEKSLRQLFGVAHEAGAVLLFDQADALIGKRGEVKDAHDRHANVEIAYLLRKIEPFEGLAVLTINHSANIDQDALGRTDVLVEFPRPDEAARERLWRLLLGSVKLPQVSDVDIRRLAEDYELSGAEILHCVRMAALLAAGDARDIDMRLLQSAAKERLAMRDAAKT